jgi:Tol biopolymer transport system component
VSSNPDELSDVGRTRGEQLISRPRFGGADNGSPVWSPDGSAIAWVGSANRGNPPDAIAIVDRDGSNARLLETPPLLEPAVLAWSPDARRLLTFLDDAHTSLVVVDATGQDGPIRIPAAGSLGGASWQRLLGGNAASQMLCGRRPQSV